MAGRVGAGSRIFFSLICWLAALPLLSSRGGVAGGGFAAAAGSIVLRVRLPNGVMRRVTAEPTDSIDALRRRALASDASAAPGGGVLDGAVFLDSLHTRAAAVDQSVDALALAHGDVLYLSAPPEP